MPTPFDPTNEEQSDNDAVYVRNQIQKFKETASPDIAKRIGEIYKKSPYIPPSIILAMAKAGTSDATIDAVKPTIAKNEMAKLDPTKDDGKNWFQRNVVDNAKAVSRWTFATLQLAPDLIQNVAAEAFSPNDPAGTKGVFRSTQLGTMLAAKQGATMEVVNPDGSITQKPIDVGSGFFLGEEGLKNQAQKAREFRGTINGHAWTIGRGAASLAFSPGSKAYSVLSGFIDGAVNVGGDPSNYIGPYIKGLRAGKAAIPALTGEEAINVARRLAKGEAGLTAAETVAFDSSKFGQFITSDARAVRMTERLAAIGADETRTLEQKKLDILDAFNDNISPEIAEHFAKAKTVDEVKGLLGEASIRLGKDPAESLIARDIRDFKLAKANIGDVAQKLGASSEFAASLQETAERVPLFRSIRNSKWFTSLPKGTVVMNGTGMDKTLSIRTYSNYLIGVGISKGSTEYEELMQKVVRAYSATDAGIAQKAVEDAYDSVFSAVFRKAGADQAQTKEALQAVIEASKNQLRKARVYNIDEAGQAIDGGAFQMMRGDIPDSALADFSPDQWDRLVFQGPGALVELAEEMQVLPSFREMRRLTGAMKFATSNKSGAQRKALTLAEFIQNDIWKPLNLATGGYLMRNLADAQVRIAMTGLDGFFNHPVGYIQWAMKRGRGFADILGQNFEELPEDIDNIWRAEQPEFRAAMEDGVHKHILDPAGVKQRNLLNGNWSEISREADATAHTTGYVDNLRLLYSDPINSKIAAIAASGENEADSLRLVQEWLQTEDGAKHRKRIIDYLKSGVKLVDPETGQSGYVRFPGEISDETIAAWTQRLSNSKVNTIVRGDNELRIVAAHNRVPITMFDEQGKIVAERPLHIDVRDIRPEDVVSGNGDVGSIIKLDNGKEGVVLSRTRNIAGDLYNKSGTRIDASRANAFEVFVIQPVHEGSAFLDSGIGSSKLRQLIDQKGAEGKLANVVKRAERGTGQPGDSGWEKIKGIKDDFTDKVFKDLFGSVTVKLERSPVFRQFYYREVFENAELISPQAAQELLDRVDEAVKTLNVSAENYVGGKKVLQKLQSVAASTSEATGTLEELDAYAKAIALRSTKDTLFDATEKNNLTDILRIVVPFGAAWQEVLGNYVKIAVEDPTRIRRAQLLFEGGRKFDMGIVGGQEGQGFFYQDPTTGDYTFNLPASGWATKLITGVESPLQAPIRGLSLGFNFNPGVGPVVQIAASKIIPDTPTTDWIVSMILPYGRKGASSLAPRWITQLEDIVRGDTTNLETIYGNTYMETLRALSTSGEYDLADANDRSKLEADARMKARVITGLRALGQFIGPTSPSVEFDIKTKQGDVYGTQLVKEFQRLQSENYDTAVSEFLNTYGNDAILYLSNKTEAVKGGLEASKQFGDWERDNRKLLKRYPDVAGFMAEGGDDFSFEVWSRQVREGSRRRLTDSEMIAAAQYKAASARYRALRDKLPANPTKEQQAWLRNWRIQLNKEYPGFPVVAEFNPGDFPAKISAMKQMVQESSLNDNETAQALKKYLEFRDEAVAKYVAAGGAEGGFGTATAAEPLREWLSSMGKAIKNETPEFARVYDRVLSYEVEK